MSPLFVPSLLASAGRSLGSPPACSLQLPRHTRLRRRPTCARRNCTRAWRLLLLLPRLLLHPAGCVGESGRKIFQGHIRKFDAGDWSELPESSRRSTQGSNRRTSAERSAEEKQEAMCRAVTALVEQDELSHAARVLKSAGFAPGSPETLAQLRDPNLRPQELRISLPDRVASFVPLAGVRLDAGLLAAALQGARRG